MYACPQQIPVVNEPLVGPPSSSGSAAKGPTAEEVLSSVLVRGAPAILGRAGEQFKRRISPVGVQVFRLQNSRVEDVVPFLKQILNIPADQDATAEGTIRIVQWAGANALAISGRPDLVGRESASSRSRTRGIRTIRQVSASGNSRFIPWTVWIRRRSSPSWRRSSPGCRAWRFRPIATAAWSFWPAPANKLPSRTCCANEKDLGQDTEVIKLDRVDPQTAVDLISKSFAGSDSKQGSVSAPQVTVDPAGHGLIVRATDNQLQQIHDLLTPMGEPPAGKTDSRTIGLAATGRALSSVRYSDSQGATTFFAHNSGLEDESQKLNLATILNFEHSGGRDEAGPVLDYQMLMAQPGMTDEIADSILDWMNGNKGVPDSTWVDLGLPVRYSIDGWAYRPLFGVLCLDLDGRPGSQGSGYWGYDGWGYDPRTNTGPVTGWQVMGRFGTPLPESSSGSSYTRIVNPVQMEVIEGLDVVVLKGSGQDVDQMMDFVRWNEGYSGSNDPWTVYSAARCMEKYSLQELSMTSAGRKEDRGSPEAAYPDRIRRDAAEGRHRLSQGPAPHRDPTR